MGAIKTREIANNNIELEITYGGLEAPFGGIDSSMPPAYIDPKCQVDVNGFAIIENQFVAVAMQLLGITLEIPVTGFTNPRLSGFGSFYTQAGGYQNFALVIGNTTTTSTTVSVNLALFVWSASNTATVTADLLVFTQPITTAPGTPAVGIIGANTGSVGHPPTLPILSVTIQLSQGLTTETYGPYATTLSPSAFCTQFTTDLAASVLVTPTNNGTSVTLTTINVGTSQNQTMISFSYSPSGAGQTPGFYPIIQSSFEGGTNNYTYPTAVAPNPLSFVSEGENLYLGGPGTGIFQYTNETFSLLSQYVGANVLKKFGGSLIALGITPSPGTQIQSPEMVMAWSEASAFGIWNPEDVNGNVTGAGFEQLDDIEDILTGGFVNSSTLIILRSKGASYATLTGNGTEPFDVNHVDLAPEGEGCQGQLLSSQYGPIGFYVGNSNVFMFVQQSQAIGDKIKSLLYPLITPQVNPTSLIPMASKAVSTYLLGNETSFYAIAVGSYLFLYNANNQTWTRIELFLQANVNVFYMEDFLLANTSGSQYQKQSQLVLSTSSSTANVQFNFWSLQEQLANINSLNELGSSITFPAEEVSFGRDITIDGLYISMAGTAGQVINWQLVDSTTNAVIGSGTFTLPAGANYSQLANYQLFDSSTQTCTSTGKAPQLTLSVPFNNSSSITQLRIAKVAMFGSFDPTQRPV